MGTLKYVVWQSKYSVGNDVLDAHHQRLSDTINLLYAAIQQKTVSHDQIQKTFSTLAQYARIHFRCEEAVMRACDYPDLPSHLKTHRSYEQRVKEYHPDRVVTLGPKIREVAEQEMKKINEAFDFLLKNCRTA